MHILLLALDINIASTSGEAIHVFELAKSLIRLGHQVLIVLPEVPGGRESLRRWEMTPSNVYFCPTTSVPGTLRFVNRIFARNGVDVIYERRFTLKIGLALKILNSTPLVAELNGLPFEAATSMGLPQMRTPLASFKDRAHSRMLEMADAIVVVSEGLRKAFLSRFPQNGDRVFTVRNGVNKDLFAPKNRNEMKRKLHLDPGVRYICYAGSLQPWHNLLMLFEALAAIKSFTLDWKLLIVGSGPMRPTLEASSNDLGIDHMVDYVGHVPYVRVNEYVNAADFCIHISRPLGYTLSPLKFLEYLACGRPVLTDDLVEVGDDLRECVKVVRHGDIEELINALMELTGNYGLVEEMTAKAREVNLDDYSWIHTASRIAEICGQVSRNE